MSAADEVRIDSLEKKQEKIFDILDDIRERLTKIETKLESFNPAGSGISCKTHDDRINKIEKSIDQLEEKVYRMLGGVTVLCFFGTYFLNAFLK